MTCEEVESSLFRKKKKNKQVESSKQLLHMPKVRTVLKYSLTDMERPKVKLYNYIANGVNMEALAHSNLVQVQRRDTSHVPNKHKPSKSVNVQPIKYLMQACNNINTNYSPTKRN